VTVRIIEGDCRAVLRTLPDASVQMCVTSPPYFGLRDYGTAQWEGGDSACDHVEPGTNRGKRDELPKPPAGWAERAIGQPYRETCGKCGARRIDAQIGLESSVDAYVAELVGVFREVRRVLRDDGTCWINLGDSYAQGSSRAGQSNSSHAYSHTNEEFRNERYSGGVNISAASVGLKPKDLIGVPWKLAFALQADGWYLRSDIIWHKPNPMPESVRDRPTKSHEYLFLLSKQPRYFWDAEAVKEPCPDNVNRKMMSGRTRASDPRDKREDAGVIVVNGSEPPTSRNIRSVWKIATSPFSEAHFATFPPDLVIPCIKAGTSERGACPACGSPWARVVETQRGPQPAERGGKNYGLNAQGTSPSSALRKVGGDDWYEYAGSTQTTGWQPTCSCAAGDPVPCVVLDPFFGAGTVGLVADRLGRDCVGIELSPVYARMARRRITADAPLFAEIVS